MMERPSILAGQEVLAEADAVIRDALSPSCTRLGRGRSATGAGEMCALYVDTSRFVIRGHEQLALSATPGRPGSRGWGALLPRSAVLAQLRDQVTGTEFVVVGTHFDHLSPWSRKASAELLRRRIAAFDAPTVLMGDLNAGTASAPVRVLARGGLRDAWGMAHRVETPPYGTLPRYRAPRAGGRRVDHILVRGGIDVVRVAVNARRPNGHWASDHLPVQAVLAVHEQGREA
jgi:endonuclease/exonuclease/phosphatase family metal-dependent hydrolase